MNRGAATNKKESIIGKIESYLFAILHTLCQGIIVFNRKLIYIMLDNKLYENETIKLFVISLVTFCEGIAVLMLGKI